MILTHLNHIVGYTMYGMMTHTITTIHGLLYIYICIHTHMYIYIHITNIAPYPCLRAQFQQFQRYSQSIPQSRSLSSSFIFRLKWLFQNDPILFATLYPMISSVYFHNFVIISASYRHYVFIIYLHSIFIISSLYLRYIFIMFHNIFNIIPLVNEHFDPENHQFLSGNQNLPTFSNPQNGKV